jgi:hypothetical protein
MIQYRDRQRQKAFIGKLKKKLKLKLKLHKTIKMLYKMLKL